MDLKIFHYNILTYPKNVDHVLLGDGAGAEEVIQRPHHTVLAEVKVPSLLWPPPSLARSALGRAGAWVQQQDPAPDQEIEHPLRIEYSAKCGGLLHIILRMF